jgi:hypothetical protein
VAQSAVSSTVTRKEDRRRSFPQGQSASGVRHRCLIDAAGEVLRAFIFHAGGAAETLRSPAPEKLYVSPFTATVTDAEGHTAQVTIRAESSGVVEFIN